LVEPLLSGKADAVRFTRHRIETSDGRVHTRHPDERYTLEADWRGHHLTISGPE
jgi:hypothetical protein